jgi:hypothetical protein
MTQEKDFRNIQMGVDTMLNTKTTIRRRRRTASDKNKELFVALINSLDEIRVRQALTYAELGLDFSTYDEKFFNAIDILLHMRFGPKSADVIAFYLYDRLNGDGSVNPLIVNGQHEVKMNDPYDLWEFLKQVNPKLDE